MPPLRHRPSLAVILSVAALAATPVLRAADSPPAAAPAPGSSSKEPEKLIGRIDKGVYASPTGRASIPVPLPAKDPANVIYDSENVVTFHNPKGPHVSLGVFPMDATLRWEDATRGRREFLVWFFETNIAPQFADFFPGSTTDPSARYLAKQFDGALLAFTDMPGGTAFEDATGMDEETRQNLVAKRGAMIWVKNETVFVLSEELGERVFDRFFYSLTPDQENQKLRDRLVDIAGTVVVAPLPPRAKHVETPAETPAPTE